jgi:pimeloyl-ACP methyl ester carboxylesterase
MSLFKHVRFKFGAAIGAILAIGVTAVAHGSVGRADPAAAPIRCAESGEKPITVVFVHGAWANTSSWQGEMTELQRDGCAVRSAPNPVQNLTTDSKAVADFVRTIPGPVLLVGHSYGGAVITNAAAEVHNVIGLVYVDAAAPAVGQTVGALSGKTSVLTTEPAAKLFDVIPGAPKGSMNLILSRSTFVNHFAQDLPRARAESLWAQQTEANTQAFSTPSRYAAWKTLPSWYFISTGDQIITQQSELAMARRAHSKVTLFHGGSHLTLISHPAAVTAVIGKALSSLLASGH